MYMYICIFILPWYLAIIQGHMDAFIDSGSAKFDTFECNLHISGFWAYLRNIKYDDYVLYIK